VFAKTSYAPRAPKDIKEVASGSRKGGKGDQKEKGKKLLPLSLEVPCRYAQQREKTLFGGQFDGKERGKAQLLKGKTGHFTSEGMINIAGLKEERR